VVATLKLVRSSVSVCPVSWHQYHARPLPTPNIKRGMSGKNIGANGVILVLLSGVDRYYSLSKFIVLRTNT